MTSRKKQYFFLVNEDNRIIAIFKAFLFFADLVFRLFMFNNITLHNVEVRILLPSSVTIIVWLDFLNL
jgi:hypothetical protein